MEHFLQVLIPLVFGLQRVISEDGSAITTVLRIQTQQRVLGFNKKFITIKLRTIVRSFLFVAIA
jgi:hypothetical protein